MIDVPKEVKIAPMHSLLTRTGAERVSGEAAETFAIFLEELGLKISKEAIDYAEHSGRRTIKSRDIEIASRKVLERGRIHASNNAIDYNRMRETVEEYLESVEKSKKIQLENKILDSGPHMEKVLDEYSENADSSLKKLIQSWKRQIKTTYRRIRHLLAF